MAAPDPYGAVVLYEGAALPVAEEIFRELEVQGKRELGPRLVRSVVVWVPVQTQYPLMFAAHLVVSGVDGNGAATISNTYYDFVFVLDSADVTWKAVWFIKSSSPGPPESGGYISTSSPPAVLIPPSQLPQAYADFLNGWLVQHKTPADTDPFAEAGYQSSLVVYRLKPPSTYVKTSMLSGYLYAPSGSSLFVLPNGDGSQTVFFSLLRSATFTGYSGGCIGADSVSYAAVPTGKYRSFTIGDYLMGVATIPPPILPAGTGIPRIHVGGDVDSGPAQLHPC